MRTVPLRGCAHRSVAPLKLVWAEPISATHLERTASAQIVAARTRSLAGPIGSIRRRKPRVILHFAVIAREPLDGARVFLCPCNRHSLLRKSTEIGRAH